MVSAANPLLACTVLSRWQHFAHGDGIDPCNGAYQDPEATKTSRTPRSVENDSGEEIRAPFFVLGSPSRSLPLLERPTNAWIWIGPYVRNIAWSLVFMCFNEEWRWSDSRVRETTQWRVIQ